MFHFTKIENSIIPTSGEIISIRNRESDRSIDHFCGDDEMNWNEEKSWEENREKKKRKNKRSIKLFLHDRSLEKSSLPARCLSPVSVKEKADFVFTSKRSDRSRYFAAIWNSIRAFLLNSKARTLNGEAKSFLFRRIKRKRYA